MPSKDCLETGLGRSVTILKWVGWKPDIFVAEVDKNFISQKMS